MELADLQVLQGHQEHQELMELQEHHRALVVEHMKFYAQMVREV